MIKAFDKVKQHPPSVVNAVQPLVNKYNEKEDLPSAHRSLTFFWATRCFKKIFLYTSGFAFLGHLK